MARKKSPAPFDGTNVGMASSSVPAPSPSNNNNTTTNNNNTLALAAAQFLQQAQQQQHQQQQQAHSIPGTGSTTGPLTNSSSSGSASAAAAVQAAAETFQQLASLMSSSAVVAAAAAANKHLLPNSTPVSSLLPPITGLGGGGSAGAPAPTATSQQQQQQQQLQHVQHHHHQQQHQQQQQNVITSQLAALLSGVGAAASTPSPPVLPPPPPNSSPSFVTQSIPSVSNSFMRHPMGAAEAAVAVAAAGGVPGAMSLPNMQNWSLEQLQQHIQLLKQLKQPIPQTVSLLLADAKRKDEKRNAKRVANRKSASTSRARKKAYVQEMTELNARLKRQALILSLLPDMVIVIGLEANITFCSAQVERVLRYDMKELEGKNLADLLIPSSRNKLDRLIKHLSGKKGGQQPKTEGEDCPEDQQHKGPVVESAAGWEASDLGESNGFAEAISSGGESSATDGGPPPTVSEPTFPLSVVQVDARRPKTTKKLGGIGRSGENSDNSTYPGKQPSSLTVSNDSVRSTSAVSLDAADKSKVAVTKDKNGGSSKNASSDLSNSSSVSTNAKSLLQANTNLERNVRIHNKKLKAELESGYKDDVTGADVTANNATARLSSLQHRSETSSSEDDSGYRESNDSREETSSSGGESSSSNGRRKPIAPTCNICLIRKDLTTIWCEVTSSIRTKEPEEDLADSVTGGNDTSSSNNIKRPLAQESCSSSVVGRSSDAGQQQPQVPAAEAEKELLLCLRPVRDGETKMQKKITFADRAANKMMDTGAVPTKKRKPPQESSWTGVEASSSAAMGKKQSNRPFKKRGLAEVSTSTTSDTFDVGEMDTDAAESLMLMNKKP